MSNEENIITIMDRQYKIKCPPEEVQILQDSARKVEETMRMIQQSSHTRNTDQVAVVTALNICRELMTLKQQHGLEAEQKNNHLRNMEERIKNYLTSEEEVPA